MSKGKMQGLVWDAVSFGNAMERGRQALAESAKEAGILTAEEFSERYERGLKALLQEDPHYLERTRRYFSSLTRARANL